MTEPMSSEALMAMIQQNTQALTAMAAAQLGQVNNDKEWQTKAMAMVEDVYKAGAQNFMTAQKLHGTTGTWSTFGLDRDVISTHVAPHGIAELLTPIPNLDEDPRYAALTGFSDDIGNEPATACVKAPTGYIKACNLTAQFGRIARSTETIDIDKVALRIRRGDFTDLVLHGLNLDAGKRGKLMPQNLNARQILNIVTMSQMVSVGVRLERKLANHIWQGDPANNNAGGGYAEFPGLDQQITTGQMDADSGTLCPSLDSDVKDFNFNNVNGSDALDIVNYISMAEYFVRTLAVDTGMDPVEWVIAVRPQLWYELSRVWPILYNTDQVINAIAAASNARVSIDGRANITDRDAMRTSMRLAVNGRSYRVIEDTGIFESNNANNANLAAGEFASSIYFVPLTVNGNLPATFRQHLNYRAAAPDIALLRGKENFWTDDGIFMWAFDDPLFCYDLTAKTEQRIVLRTPQLAFRIDNVLYSPLQHLREADPASPYHVDGGVSVRAVPTKQSVWL